MVYLNKYAEIERPINLEVVLRLTMTKSATTTVAVGVTAGTSQNLIDNGCVLHDPKLYSYDYVWPDGIHNQCSANADEWKELFLHVLGLQQKDNGNNSHRQAKCDAFVHQLIQQYRRDGFLVFPDAISTVFTDIQLPEKDDDDDHTDEDHDYDDDSPETATNSHSATTRSYHERIVKQLDRDLHEFVDGTNVAFADDVREQLLHSKQQVPDFTNGDKIPWIQYEAGTILSSSSSLSKMAKETTIEHIAININNFDENTNNNDDTDENYDLVFTPSTAPYVRKIMGFVNGYSPTIDAIANHPNLLYIVQKLLYSGLSNNYSHCNDNDSEEIELFQDMALLKPSDGGREKPWHQDKAYFNVHVAEPVVGCWMAIDHATIYNGCLRFELPYHPNKSNNNNTNSAADNIYNMPPQMHHMIRDYQLCDTVNRDGRVIVVPLAPGGMILFDGMIAHGTPTNRTTAATTTGTDSTINGTGNRRALQFHWIKKHAKRCTTIERMNTFGGIPNGHSC